MKNKDVKAVLDKITKENLTNGTLGDLWRELPDFISGEAWVGEIEDCADRLKDYLYEDEEEVTADIWDVSAEFGDNAIEDYHKNIIVRVYELELWAYVELDDEVEEIAGGYKSLTDLNRLYLYSAMRGLAYRVLTYAYENAEESE